MFGRTATSLGEETHLERVAAWTRARFGLSATDLVMVSQARGRLPGYPPLETVVLFWTADDRRHRFRVFRPAAEVTPEDIPVSWLRPSLVDDGEAGCC